MRHSIFTVEVCARLDVSPLILDRLRPIVQGAPERLTRQEGWGRHGAAADVLIQFFHAVERGCWEYFDDEENAMSMFDDWCRPLLDGYVPRQTRPTPLERPPDPIASPRYVLFTMVYLLVRDSPSDLAVRDACDVPEGDLWRRNTLFRLLGTVRTLSFASVKSNAMYMVPRDLDWGLTAGELSGPAYGHLRPLVGG